jgi:ribonuclease P protein component
VESPRIGIAVSRQVAGSVRRNRARRRLREAARQRLLPDDSPLRMAGMTYHVVLIARPAAVDAPFDELASDVGRLGRRLASLSARQ